MWLARACGCAALANPSEIRSGLQMIVSAIQPQVQPGLQCTEKRLCALAGVLAPTTVTPFLVRDQQPSRMIIASPAMRRQEESGPKLSLNFLKVPNHGAWSLK